ncbi:YcgJ family protein [Brucella anthropi]|uniref:YcgJ family protein n=1 Tax=Brucella anthropi TaxID=529 RepID=UPI003CC7DED2
MSKATGISVPNACPLIIVQSEATATRHCETLLFISRKRTPDMKLILPIVIAAITPGLFCTPTCAAQSDSVYSPANGILCDKFFCADASGISNGLTMQYLGNAAAEKLASQSGLDRTKFTLSNGVFCDVEQRKCYKDQYRGPNAGTQRSVSAKFSRELFGSSFLRFWRPHI